MQRSVKAPLGSHEPALSNKWTETLSDRGWPSLEMDQGVAGLSQAKVPLLLTQIVNQLLMHEAAICKKGDHFARWHDGIHLVEHQLVVFKTNLGTSMTQCWPSERNSATTIHE